MVKMLACILEPADTNKYSLFPFSYIDIFVLLIVLIEPLCKLNSYLILNSPY